MDLLGQGYQKIIQYAFMSRNHIFDEKPILKPLSLFLKETAGPGFQVFAYLFYLQWGWNAEEESFDLEKVDTSTWSKFISVNYHIILLIMYVNFFVMSSEMKPPNPTLGKDVFSNILEIIQLKKYLVYHT